MIVGLDQRGWQDLAALLEHTLTAVQQIHADSAVRAAESLTGEPAIDTEIALKLFRRPKITLTWTEFFLPALRLAFPEPLLTATQRLAVARHPALVGNGYAKRPSDPLPSVQIGRYRRFYRPELGVGRRGSADNRTPRTARTIGAGACPVWWVCRLGALTLSPGALAGSVWSSVRAVVARLTWSRVVGGSRVRRARR